MSKFRIAVLSCAAVALVAAGCGSDDDTTDEATTASGAVSLDDCTPDTLQTVSDGQLTVATDKPAFPPYFEDNDPTNGKGFESAVAYAIADQLGYDAADVKWTVVPFNASYAPGPKNFDFDVNQISITPKRAEQVDFSRPVLRGRQAVVAPKGSSVDGATLARRPQGREIGVQIGTTSLDAVNEIDPAVQRPAGLRQLQRRRLRAQAAPGRRRRRRPPDRALHHRRPGARRRRRRPVPGARAATRGARCWQKDSPLTDCVSSGGRRLQSPPVSCTAIEQQWMSKAAGAPELPVAPRLTMADRRAVPARAARRRQARRGPAIAALSSVVIIGGLDAADPDQPGLARRQARRSSPGTTSSAPSRTSSTASGSTSALRASSSSSCSSSALVVALIRTTRAPALFPLRLLATVYTDVFRGIPTVLLVYLVGFGVPALARSAACRPTRWCSAGSRWRSPTAPTSPRSTAPASLRAPAASATAALAIGLTERQAMRHVSSPRRCGGWARRC